MNNELLLLNKKHTDTLIEQTKSKPQKTFEFKLNKQMETFSFNPPINVVEVGEELLAATSFEATKSNFKTTDENNSFSIGTPGYWRIPNFLPEGIIDRLKKLLELRCQSDNKLRVKKVEKSGTRIQIEKKDIIYQVLTTLKVKNSLNYD